MFAIIQKKKPVASRYNLLISFYVGQYPSLFQYIYTCGAVRGFQSLVLYVVLFYVLLFIY